MKTITVGVFEGEVLLDIEDKAVVDTIFLTKEEASRLSFLLEAALIDLEKGQ